MTTDNVSDRDEALAALDADFATIDRLDQLDIATLTEAELWLYLEANARVERAMSIVQRALINSLAHATPEELGGELPDVLAETLHISRVEAEQRINEAAGANEARPGAHMLG